MELRDVLENSWRTLIWRLIFRQAFEIAVIKRLCVANDGSIGPGLPLPATVM
jgi:hypothetical protein